MFASRAVLNIMISVDDLSHNSFVGVFLALYKTIYYID